MRGFRRPPSRHGFRMRATQQSFPEILPRLKIARRFIRRRPSAHSEFLPDRRRQCLR